MLLVMHAAFVLLFSVFLFCFSFLFFFTV